MTIQIHGNNIERLNIFPTTLINELTDEKMVIEIDQSGYHSAFVKIRRLSLNSALSFQEMWKMNREKLPEICIDMV